ncbi:CelD/BcsL family acetyltransferase involved in cellulose biosynthesis [Pontibacter mucosus]|uniref:CelD/BcsL family acetyltransferase involved in cellulose biosynthesis n=1 Tax=Pontibacter mucosus TaxID=1649266 RepID=A0A2T5YE57_9BACT|nr:GNAT family N-acetyltransferase [Pontibacter mucosus]PTX14993.1 CelD/BcsL family acetyltransferase involved in cellulose biosynthesis [Pontibacter mucosus]
MKTLIKHEEDNEPYKGIIGKAPLKTELHVGKQVFNALLDPALKAEWDLLYEACTWCTVFQSRVFVETWYKVFREEYLPILVTATHEGHLVGVLAMALPRYCVDEHESLLKPGKIVGAGQYDAEYQCWLSGAAYGEDFIKAALASIIHKFRGCDIHFRYLPPALPLNWAEADPYWRNKVVLQAVRRPLMAMGSPEFPKLFKKPEFKNKVNRLRRLGNLSFEVVTDKSYFEEILPELVIQYDFRQGAMFNKNQFSDNPLKTEFLLAIFEKKLLHVSVLKVNEEVMAAIVAVAGKGWVHLGGINTHAPYQANYYSPGFVHFIMLGKLLAESGVEVFDLTPGGDAYKERLATDHDQVYEMVIPGSTVSGAKRRIRKHLYNRLVQAGKRPMSVELAIRKKAYLFKARLKSVINPHTAFSTLFRLRASHSPDEKPSVGIPAELRYADGSIHVQENDLKHLLAYRPTKHDLTRWEFLEAAMRSLETGKCCYTWCEDGQLQACAWLGSSETVPLKPALPKGSAVLELTYYCKAVKRMLPAFLTEAARLVRQQRGTPVYFVDNGHGTIYLDNVSN